jgi:hypothetical protein
MTTTNVSIRKINDISIAYNAEGGSDIIIAGGSISESSSTKGIWTAIRATESSTVEITGTTIDANTNLQHGFSASNAARVRVKQVPFAGNSGGQATQPNVVSAVAFANMGSTINMEDLVVTDVSDFLAVYFAGFGSRVGATRTCIESREADATVYISEDSTIGDEDNYVSTEFSSMVCSEAGTGLVQEKVGSQCFEMGTDECEFDCRQYASANECLAAEQEIDPMQTPAPARMPSPAMMTTKAPTKRPVKAPTMRATERPTNAPSAGPTLSPSLEANLDTERPVRSTNNPTTSRLTARPTPQGSTKTPTIANFTRSPRHHTRGKGKGKGGSLKGKGKVSEL